MSNKKTYPNTICLALIVRNEAHCIERCLESVAPFVDNILIHDTGSTDDTVGVITKYIKKNRLHGFVEEVDWKDFGHNRSYVLERARNTADYTFMLDADEVLSVNSTKFRAELGVLDKDIYSMRVKLGDLNFTRHFLFKNSLEWKYLDPIHEYAHCDSAFTPGDIEHAHIVSFHDGGRSKDPQKYLKDAHILKALPNRTPRQQFYLAQCLKDAGLLDECVNAYKRRIDMENGWWQERYFSFYMIGRLTRDPKALLEAYLLEPLRAEPLLILGKILMDQKNWNAAQLFLTEAACLKAAPEGALFVESDVYDWRAQMELYVCMYYQGLYSTALTCNERLLEKVPESVRPQLRENIRFCAEALHKEKSFT